MRLEHAVLVQRPVEDVFDVVGNPDNDSRWGSLIVASRQLTPGSIGVGTRFEQTATFLGGRTSFSLEITRFDPDRQVCYDITQPLVLNHCRTFERVPSGTRLTFSSELELPSGFKVAGSVVARIGKRQMEEDLDAVKSLLESGGRIPK